MSPQHTRRYGRSKGRGARAEPSPAGRDRHREGTTTEASRDTRWGFCGNGMVGQGEPWRREMERDNGRGASQAGVTIDWSYTG